MSPFRQVLTSFPVSIQIMSRSADDREGLSPSPANILDFLGEEDEDDDIYEPTTEQSEMTASTAEDEEEDDGEFAGQSIDMAPSDMLMRDRCS